LYDEQKLTTASNSNNEYVTPFKITVNNINNFMKDKDNEFLTVIVKNIKHHYKGDIAATRNIRFLVEKNVIKGFYITKENNKIVLKKYGF
jgi:hypothetical protein